MMDVNWLAILAAGIINMIVGSLWYSPLLFLKPWMATLPKKDKENKNVNMGKIYGIMFVGALVMAYVMAMFTKVSNTTMIDTGALLGFWIWLGFVVPVQLGGVLFEERPWKWFAITAGYYLVVLILIGALLSVWK
jgi:hypothetical protein